MYYEALSLADAGVYEPIVELVAENCSILIKIQTELLRPLCLDFSGIKTSIHTQKLQFL